MVVKRGAEQDENFAFGLIGWFGVCGASVGQRPLQDDRSSDHQYRDESDDCEQAINRSAGFAQSRPEQMLGGKATEHPRPPDGWKRAKRRFRADLERPRSSYGFRALR